MNSTKFTKSMMATLKSLERCAETLVQMVAPFAPHMAEEIVATTRQ